MPYIIVNDCKIFYTVQGHGTPILFIHPPVLTHINFQYQMEELSKYFQVIAFDIRGHGRSTFSKERLTYPLIVEDMKHILDDLDIEKAFVCGYSTGGSIALEFLLSQTDRAAGGIIISGMSEVSDWLLKNKISLGIALAASKAINTLALSIAWTNSITKPLYWNMVREARKGKAKNIEEYYRYSLSYHCTDRLGEIDHPVLLIYGQKDHMFKRYAEFLHDKLPDNQLNWIPNVKHQIPTKAASQLNDLIKQFVYSHEESDTYQMIPDFLLQEAEASPENLQV
ncbi:alpha/beta fold hydrolase [Ammoniphilus resinae]|uniref:Pimeloyl-ACP methyl ester carboxylesterase n=1 Tax=Ammoniphilus resinae TaxID=861532 RepID=A0ABS4GVM9_9BACL|nr:alpha/beta hydrolase [Ammoniphilus resinae]MBP1934320.1 pimeloyl-ACP methyl ester carboxylesterase [Ammoniphilus resinae]